MRIDHDLPWLPSPSRSTIRVGADAADPRLVTAAFVLPVADDGRILCARVRRRGLDVGGGHVEAGETPEAAARREAQEEMGAVTGPLVPLGTRELSVPAPPAGYRYPTPLSYHAFYTARLQRLGPLEMPEECDEPLLVRPEDFARHERLAPFLDLARAAGEVLRLAQRVRPPDASLLASRADSVRQSRREGPGPTRVTRPAAGRRP